MRSSSHIGESEIAFVEALLDGAFDSAAEDVGAETRFLADGAGETDAIDSLESVDHCADGFEAAGDIGFCFLEIGHDGLGEFKEECFAGFGAVALVCEGEFFVGSAAKLDEIEVVGFEAGTELFGFFGLEPALLELDTVNFDTDNE